MANPAIDLTGKRFGYLKVLSRAGTTAVFPYRAVWLCRCDCGNEVDRVSQSLRTKHRTNPRHCGCRHGEHLISHGMSDTRPFVIWTHMRRRCEKPDFKDYRNYGARGIKVCRRWQKFENFWADMKKGYKPNLTLDRKNNDGNYTPRNCRWATAQQQRANQRPRSQWSTTS